MGLFKTYQISEKAAQEGVLYEFKDATNVDGTTPGIFVGYSGGKGSTAHMAALQLARKPYAKRIEQGDVKAQEAFSEIANGLFCDNWIKGWQNIFDEDDQPIEYTKENCRALMKSLPTVLHLLVNFSVDEANFNQEELKASAKN